MTLNSEETFTCEVCGQTFLKGRKDSEAMAELRAEYGPEVAAGEPVGVVCGPCFREFQAWCETPAGREIIARTRGRRP